PTEVNLRFEDFGPTSIRLRWGASTDNVGVTEYIVRYGDGKEVRVPATSAAELSTLIEGLTPDSDYLFEITARDAAGAESEPLTLLLVTFPAPPVLPGKVSGLTGTPGETSIELRWSAPPEPDGTVASYNVYRGSTRVATVTGTSATVSGLTADTAYTFSVEAIGRSGLAGPRSEALTFKTLPPRVSPPRVTFSLKGSTSIKTLTKGNLPLAGSLDNVNLLLATGQLSGDLTLADTQGRLTALGFLPVTAKIGFVPSGKTTGTINDGVLSTKSFIRIKVKEVKLFGAIPLAGGNNCQTKSLSEINLQSTQPEFNPYQGGGPIAGTYRISDLNGCGVLNGLVSPLTAGGGNTINLNLTPKPAA
ncbi:MAG: fibronectin type III domain-containing protein, partial [Solirubrobacteraceae bacterium]|nr:fibronectin type III domain-containing protein [Solirubrobacteraceae bacterium]